MHAFAATAADGNPSAYVHATFEAADRQARKIYAQKGEARVYVNAAGELPRKADLVAEYVRDHRGVVVACVTLEGCKYA